MLLLFPMNQANIEVDELYEHFFLENKQKNPGDQKIYECVEENVCALVRREDGGKGREGEGSDRQKAPSRALSWFGTNARDADQTIREHQYP